MRTPIVQFGTSRFLQAHADLFISDAMRDGQAVGPVTVVQTTGGADRAGRLAAFDGRPLPIVVRGLENGKPVERTEYTTCLVRGLSTATDWDEIERIVVEEADQIISNTGDSGYRMPEGETIGDGVPVSFPAKLTRLLAARWRAVGHAAHPLPDRARPRQRRRAPAGSAPGSPGVPACRRTLPAGWMARLRLRQQPGRPHRLRRAGAGRRGRRALCALGDRGAAAARHAVHPPGVRVVDDLRVTERLKLFLLNLPHTCLAERWLADGRPADETVREMVADPAIRAWLDAHLRRGDPAGLRRRRRRRGAGLPRRASSTASAIPSSTIACPTSSPTIATRRSGGPAG